MAKSMSILSSTYLCIEKMLYPVDKECISVYLIISLDISKLRYHYFVLNFYLYRFNCQFVCLDSMWHLHVCSAALSVCFYPSSLSLSLSVCLSLFTLSVSLSACLPLCLRPSASVSLSSLFNQAPKLYTQVFCGLSSHQRSSCWYMVCMCMCLAFLKILNHFHRLCGLSVCVHVLALNRLCSSIIVGKMFE